MLVQLVGRVLFVATVFTCCTAQASDCSVSRPVVQMIHDASSIYVGDATQLTISSGMRVYDFNIVETFKGTKVQSIQLTFPLLQHESKANVLRDFNSGKRPRYSHNNIAFWLGNKAIRSGLTRLDCSQTFYPGRGRFVVFKGLNDLRAVEPVFGKHDAWLAAVKKISKGDASDFKVTPVQLLKKFRSVYTSTCGEGNVWLRYFQTRKVFGEAVSAYSPWASDRLIPQIPYAYAYCIDEVTSRTVPYVAGFSSETDRFPVAFPIINNKVIFEKRYGDFELTNQSLPIDELETLDK